MNMRTNYAFLILSVVAVAQPTVAPTNESVGTVRGENRGSYNILNSFETGYRFRSVGGDVGKYNSDVNYGSGLRLLSSSLSINSREGRGGLFDEIMLSESTVSELYGNTDSPG